MGVTVRRILDIHRVAYGTPASELDFKASLGARHPMAPMEETSTEGIVLLPAGQATAAATAEMADAAGMVVVAAGDRWSAVEPLRAHWDLAPAACRLWWLEPLASDHLARGNPTNRLRWYDLLDENRYEPRKVNTGRWHVELKRGALGPDAVYVHEAVVEALAPTTA